MVGDPILLDELAHEIEIGLRRGGEAHLDLPETHAHQQFVEAPLAIGPHRLDERLVAVAQIDAAPDRRSGDDLIRPGPVGQGDRGNQVFLQTVQPVAAHSPLLTTPNEIGEAAWKNWVQERGTYFLAEDKDSRYHDVLQMEDNFPYNKGMKTGALVEASYGKGRWLCRAGPVAAAAGRHRRRLPDTRQSDLWENSSSDKKKTVGSASHSREHEVESVRPHRAPQGLAGTSFQEPQDQGKAGDQGE